MSAAWSSTIAAVWVSAVILAVDPQGWYPFGPVKWLLVSSGVCLLCAAVFAARRVVVAPRVQLAMIGLVATITLAAATGVDGVYAWLGTPERHFGAVTWLLLALSFFVGLNLTHPTRLLWGVAIAGVLVGAAATAEAVGWEPRVFAVDDRLTATLGSPAYLGAVVAVLLPVVAATACDTALSCRLRLVAAMGTPLLVIAALGSGARAAWLGVAAATIVLGCRRGPALRARAAPRTIVVGAIAALTSAIVIVAVSPVGSRVASLFDDDSPGGRGRIDEWRVAVRVAGDHLALGVGPEGYRIAFAGGVDDAYEREHGRDPTPDRAHSAPLDVLLTGGLAALALWCAVVALIGRHAWRAVTDERTWLAGAGAALIAHFVGLLVLFPLAELEPIVWLLAGVVVTSTAPSSDLRALAVPRALAAIPVAAAAIALIAGAFDVVADRRAYDATVALSRGEVQRAYAHASAAAARRPDEVRLHLLEAETARRADRGAVTALDAIDDALTVSPRDPIVLARHLALLVERAEATQVPDQATVARDAIEAAVRHDPRNAQLRMLEGRAARVAGDESAAERAWTIAEDLAPRSPAPAADLALLYLEQGRLDLARAALGRAAARAPDDPLVMAVRARVEGAG